MALFEEFLNKRVRIHKQDGHEKYGWLRNSDGRFIRLEFYTGSTIYLSVNEIESIELAEGEVKQ